MKKVIGIFMAMLFAFIFVGMAFGEDPMTLEMDQVDALLNDWLISQKLYEKYNWRFDEENGTYYAKGVLSNGYFKELTNEDFTMEGLERLYINNKEHGENWDIYYSNVRLTGFIENYNVYILTINSNNALGTENLNGKEYYNVQIMFMVSM